MPDVVRNMTHGAWGALRRRPFTVANVVALVAVAIWSGTAVSAMSPQSIVRFGFAPADLLTAGWFRAITSMYFTGGGVTFWMAVLLLATLAGAAEALWGTRRVALLFWGSHLTTLLVVLALAVALVAGGSSLGHVLYTVRDVGPSAGYVGCLAALLLALPRTWRSWMIALVAGGLLFALGQTLAAPIEEAVEISAAVTHVVALTLGMGLGLLLRGARLRSRDEARPRLAT